MSDCGSWTVSRTEGGIPPLVELLEFNDAKVQRAVAGALRTLAFKNDENKKQVMDLSGANLSIIDTVFNNNSISYPSLLLTSSSL